MAKFKGLIRNCVVCGNEYRSPQSHAHVLTCSRECGYRHRRVANKVEHVQLQCKHCGGAFAVPPSHATRRVYCSEPCRDGSAPIKGIRSSSNVGPLNPNWRQGATIMATSATGKVYGRQQPHLENEKSVRRGRALAKATPSWVDLDKVKAIYAWARAISWETGLMHHVDHAVPLVSDLVCGLHVEHNLCVLTGPDNLKKSNRTWPDMW